MNVSGLVLRSRPDRTDAVQATLARMPGVEVRGRTPAGHLVVVAEHGDAGTAADAFVELNRIEGVLSVSLVYQFNDDGPARPEE